jgi:hypothetical protein
MSAKKMKGLRYSQKGCVQMVQILDEKMKEFIHSELEKIKSDKEKFAEEKGRIWNEIFKLLNAQNKNETPEHKKRLELLHKYNVMLINEYELLCERDIVLFQIVAGIGEIARESECRVSQEIDENEEVLSM